MPSQVSKGKCNLQWISEDFGLDMIWKMIHLEQTNPIWNWSIREGSFTLAIFYAWFAFTCSMKTKQFFQPDTVSTLNHRQ